ncbi:hypothetical protein O0L34_g15591 [Tuta absoluta]|nr:hypothetical protein O0L34_g15591 [Tuta absoluta]
MWLYLSLAVTSILYFVYWYITRNFNFWKNRNVAFVEPVPFFGNIKESALKQKFIGEILQDIYAKFPKEKVVGIYTMTTPALLLRDPDIIKQVMIKDFDLFADRGVEFS